MSDKPTPGSLAAALVAFQASLPHVGRDQRATVKSDKGSYTYSYANLADVSAKVLPLLAAQGLSFSAKPTLDESGRFVLEYRLRHVGGEEDVGTYPLANGTPQQVGSSITYARRYALLAVSGVAPDIDDDDGQAAEQAGAPRIDPADAARARLKSACERHGWARDVVAAKFAERYPAGIDAETDQARIDKFREYLTSLPQHELTATAEAVEPA